MASHTFTLASSPPVIMYLEERSKRMMFIVDCPNIVLVRLSEVK